MKNAFSLLSMFVLSLIFFNLPAGAQENLSITLATGNNVRTFDLSFSEPYFKNRRSAQIKDIQIFGENSGIAYTSDALFLTSDNGENWREIALPRDFNQTISAVSFLNENIGWAILADERNVTLQLFKTRDGGNYWTKTSINLRQEDLQEAELGNVRLHFSDEQTGLLTLRLAANSNFVRQAIYLTDDSGLSWNFSKVTLEKATEKRFTSFSKLGNWRIFDDAGSLPKDEGVIRHSFDENSHWVLASSGNCEGFKTGCVQTTKIYRNTSASANRESKYLIEEITPPEIKELSRREKEKAKIEARNSNFAAPPEGSTRISLNRGFDKCTAANVAQMQTWWNNSPFYDANIYMSGRNRGCSQAQLTAAWVNQVSAMGWGLIPTIVGYQAPCSVCTSLSKTQFRHGNRRNAGARRSGHCHHRRKQSRTDAGNGALLRYGALRRNGGNARLRRFRQCVSEGLDRPFERTGLRFGRLRLAF